MWRKLGILGRMATGDSLSACLAAWSVTIRRYLLCTGPLILLLSPFTLHLGKPARWIGLFDIYVFYL